MDYRFTTRRRFLVTQRGRLRGGAAGGLRAGARRAGPTAAPRRSRQSRPSPPRPRSLPRRKPAGAPTTGRRPPSQPRPRSRPRPTKPAAAPAEAVANIPRNRTLIMAGLGGEHPGGFTDIDTFNQYLPGLSRSGYTQAGTEGLFYYAPLNNEFQPWLAESFQFANDFTEVTVKLRKGVEWSDGKPFTAKDVIFTFEMLAPASRR